MCTLRTDAEEGRKENSLPTFDRAEEEKEGKKKKEKVNNNNNEYLERTGPKRLHVLYKKKKLSLIHI